MKKRIILAIFLTSVLVLFSIGFTGCEEPMIAPEDTWCKMTTNVSGVDLDMYFMYTQKDDGFKTNKVTFEPGLTVLVTQKNASPTSVYAYKTFVIGEEVSTKELNEAEGIEDDATEDRKFTVKATAWDAIYVANYKSAFISNRKTTAPEIVEKGTSVEQLKQIFEGVDISWKKVIVNILIGWLNS